MDFGSKEDSASYREEDAAKTGHAVGSRGPGGGNEKRAHGARRFIARTACTSLTTVRVLSTSLTLQHTYITAFAALAHSVTVTKKIVAVGDGHNHGPLEARAPDILVVVSHASLKPQGVQNSIDQVSESGSLS